MATDEKFSFVLPHASTRSAIKAMGQALQGESWGEWIHFAADGSDITVTVQKLGTSTMRFARGADGRFTLSDKTVALAHRMFQNDVRERIKRLIGSIGGTVDA